MTTTLEQTHTALITLSDDILATQPAGMNRSVIALGSVIDPRHAYSDLADTNYREMLLPEGTSLQKPDDEHSSRIHVAKAALLHVNLFASANIRQPGQDESSVWMRSVGLTFAYADTFGRPQAGQSIALKAKAGPFGSSCESVRTITTHTKAGFSHFVHHSEMRRAPEYSEDIVALLGIVRAAFDARIPLRVIGKRPRT